MQFADFNRDQFRTWNLALQIKQAGDYQFIIVKGLPGYAESMSYFRKVITERSLFRTLGQTIYRNFIITEANLNKVLVRGDVDPYLEFFRNNYIQKAGQTTIPATGQTVQNAGVPETGKQENAVPEIYSGPYLTGSDTTHRFVLIVPVDGFSKAELLNELKKFNEADFSALKLTVSEKQLDDNRMMILVDGLGKTGPATAYFRQLVGNRAIYAPLGDASYRNFIISPVNYEIFLQRKNITEYLDFFRKTYLNN
jgi:hypothetical protein